MEENSEYDLIDMDAHADSNYTYVPATPTYLDDDSNMSDYF